MPATEQSPSEMRVLLLAPTARDAQASGGLFESNGVNCSLCTDLGQMCEQILIGAGIAILPEEIVLADRREQLAQTLANQPVWSDIPVIVLSSGGIESPAVSKAI